MKVREPRTGPSRPSRSGGDGRDRHHAFLRRPVPSVITDHGGTIVDANVAAARLLGAGREELVGLSLRSSLHPDSRRAFDALMLRLERLEKADPLVLKLADGRLLNCSAAAFQASGAISGMLQWMLQESPGADGGDGLSTGSWSRGGGEVEARLLFQAAMELFEARTTEAVASRAAGVAARTLCEGAVLDLVEPGEGLRRAAAAGTPYVKAGVPVHPLMTELLDDGGSRTVTDPEALAALYGDLGLPEGLDPPGKALLLAVPHGDRAGVAGVFSFLTGRRDGALHPRRLLLQSYTRVVARALANAEALEAERARRTEAGTLARGRYRALVGLCHDFRAPLQAIMGYADLLLDGIPAEVPEASRRHVAAIRRVADHLAEMVTGTTRREHPDPSKVAEGPVALGPVLQQVRDVVVEAAEAKGLALSVTGDGDGVALSTDASALRKVLVNLVDNAVKYTAEGDVRLHVDVEPSEVAFRVTDTGRGISTDDLAHVFEPFWRGEISEGSIPPGSGVGLSVVKELVEGLGGRITIESGLGEGTTVVVFHPR